MVAYQDTPEVRSFHGTPSGFRGHRLESLSGGPSPVPSCGEWTPSRGSPRVLVRRLPVVSRSASVPTGPSLSRPVNPHRHVTEESVVPRQPPSPTTGTARKNPSTASRPPPSPDTGTVRKSPSCPVTARYQTRTRLGRTRRTLSPDRVGSPSTVPVSYLGVGRLVTPYPVPAPIPRRTHHDPSPHKTTT